MPWGSASSSARILQCPGSTVLPREDLQSENAKKRGELGTKIHSIISEIHTDLKLGKDTIDDLRYKWKNNRHWFTTWNKIPKRIERLIDDDDFLELLSTFDYSEHSCAISCINGYTIRYFSYLDRETRDNKLADCYISGTADLVREIGTSLDYNEYKYLEVSDIKTGFKPPQAKDNAQLLTLATSLWLNAWPSKESDNQYTLSIIHIDQRGGFSKDNWYIKHKELEEHFQKLKKTYQQSLIRPIITKRGIECNYCPCRTNCPEYKKK